MDEAVIVFGLLLESELEEAGQGKKSKEQIKTEAARQRIYDRVFGQDNKTLAKSFADPAAMFG